MGACFSCYTVLQQVYQSVLVPVWTWITTTWTQCVEQDCNWWCLCCNKWLCWISLIVIAVLSFVVFLILEIIAVVVCTVISVWCILCNIVCWIGCLGQKGCYDNCATNSPCTSPTIEFDTDFPLSSSSALSGSKSSAKPGTRPQGDAHQAVATGSISITHLNELDALLSWRALASIAAVRIRLSGVAEKSSQQMEAMVNRYLPVCGCKEGKVGLLIASALWITLYFLPGLPTSVIGVRGFWGGLLIVLFGAVVGKMFGVVRARLALGQQIRLLQSAMT